MAGVSGRDYYTWRNVIRCFPTAVRRIGNKRCRELVERAVVSRVATASSLPAGVHQHTTSCHSAAAITATPQQQRVHAPQFSRKGGSRSYCLEKGKLSLVESAITRFLIGWFSSLPDWTKNLRQQTDRHTHTRRGDEVHSQLILLHCSGIQNANYRRNFGQIIQKRPKKIKYVRQNKYVNEGPDGLKLCSFCK